MEQKRCAKGTRGTGELQDIDQYILKESKTRRKNNVMAWIDYKMINDIVAQTYIIECLNMFKISDEVKNRK